MLGEMADRRGRVSPDGVGARDWLGTVRRVLGRVARAVDESCGRGRDIGGEWRAGGRGEGLCAVSASEHGSEGVGWDMNGGGHEGWQWRRRSKYGRTCDRNVVGGLGDGRAVEWGVTRGGAPGGWLGRTSGE